MIFPGHEVKLCSPWLPRCSLSFLETKNTSGFSLSLRTSPSCFLQLSPIFQFFQYPQQLPPNTTFLHISSSFNYPLTCSSPDTGCSKKCWQILRGTGFSLRPGRHLVLLYHYILAVFFYSVNLHFSQTSLCYQLTLRIPPCYFSWFWFPFLHYAFLNFSSQSSSLSRGSYIKVPNLLAQQDYFF